MFSPFYHSTIGKKIIVATTGLILLGFVIGHLLGNLQFFAGPDKFNGYAAFLKGNPPLLWGTRLILLISVALHFATTVQLVRLNRASRPVAYDVVENIQARWSSKTMIWGGLFLAIYIIFHLLHFTTGQAHPDFSHTDVYGNVISGFSVWYVSVFYILGMAALGFHLHHGAWSIFQTLGLNHPKYNAWRRCFATMLAWIIFLGYISIPIAVMAGIVK